MITPDTAKLLERKAEQGFVRLQLTPLTIPLKTLIGAYKALLLEKHQQGKLLSTKGDELPLDESVPLYIYETFRGADTGENLSQSIVYHPKRFTRDHQGQTKTRLIQQGRNWEVELVEDLPDLPAQGQGEEKGGRAQFEADRTPNDYLQTLQTDPSYSGEQGFTMEDWLIYAVTKLQEEDIQIDDWQGQGKACYNTGSYLPAGSDVSDCGFIRTDARPYLVWDSSGARGSNISVRSSVKINRLGI